MLPCACRFWFPCELGPPTYRSQFQALRTALAKTDREFGWNEFDGHGRMSDAYSINTDLDPVGDAVLAFIRSLPR